MRHTSVGKRSKSILTGELDIGVPTTFVSENHGCVVVHRGTHFPSSRSDAESNETGCVRMAHSDTKIIPRIKPTWYGGEMKGKRNSCRGMRWSLQGSEWESNSKHVDDMARLWRLKLESKETPTLVTKETERRRDIDETLMQHNVRAFRGSSWNKLSGNEIVDTEGNLAVQTPGRPESTARMSEHTSDSRRSDQGNCVEHCGRTSVLRCEAIADQTDTQKVRVTWHCQTIAGDSIVVARASSIAWKHAGGCVRAGAGSTATFDGWIIKDRVDIEANLPDLGADRNGSRGKDDLWQQCNM